MEKAMFQVSLLTTKVPQGGTQGYQGILIDIIKELSVMLNFT